jgi:drug/metabolite transporter (DMT)-like permease
MGVLVLILVLVGLITWLLMPPGTRSVGPWVAVIVAAAVTAAGGTIWYVTLPNLSDDVVTITQLPVGFVGLLAGLALIILGAVLRIRSTAAATADEGKPATAVTSS